MVNPYDQKIDEYPTTNPYNEKDNGRVLGWISGGVASAMACHFAQERYGDQVELVFQDTSREHEDTFRFIADLEKFWGKDIKIIHSERFKDPEEIWLKYGGMNFAHGAPCSTELKQRLRVQYQDLDNDFGHVFGFDYGDKKEENRARNMISNHPEINPIFPLIVEKFNRFKVFSWLKKQGIKPPEMYNNFANNNCMGNTTSAVGGCVQGSVGYWQRIKELYPDKYHYMACWEHILSSRKGEPVTMCKNQQKGKNGNRLFLEFNPEFPSIETIDVVKGRPPVSMMECNGFCGIGEQIELF